MSNDNQKSAITRREALEKLAKLSAYSAPAVTALFTAQQSYAQTSEANMNLNNGQIEMECEQFGDLTGNLGNDGGSGWGAAFNDTTGDCGVE